MAVTTAERRARVTAHSTRSDRVVFTESGNRDGWLASDTVVDIER